ncbi:MAG: hypothetical protein AAB598_00615 [Patescibacteria group bacterium]
MRNLVQKALGEERISEICEEYGLSKEDEKIINEIFDKWDGLFGETGKKIEIVFDKTFHLPQRLIILKALFRISKEFANKKIKEKMH